MDPIELARRLGMDLFKARQYLAASILYGEALKLRPDDPGLLLGFGAGVGSSAGRLVIEPFIQWSTRILNRCIEIELVGDNATIARQRLAELVKSPHYRPLPPMTPSDLEPLLEFLDVSPSTIMAEAVAALPDDRTFALMALGELGSPRFASAVAMAVSGVWGTHPGCAALKRIRPYAAHRIVRGALSVLRTRPDAESFEPYLGWAEKAVEPVPITIETPPGYLRVRPPPAAPGASA